MELRIRMTRKRVAIFAAALAVVATGSVGWAAIGDGGTIQGCVTVNGTIDALDETTLQCKDRQTFVEWYTKGGSESAFLGKTGKAADADKLDGLDSTAFLGATGKAADADKLDGLDSTAFLGATGKAADADRLDGRDSSAYLQTCPSGMVKVVDFCSETTLRPAAAWHVATNFCGGPGRSLPDMSQVFKAWAFNRVPGLFPATAVPVFTNDFVSGNELKAPIVSSSGFNHFGTAPDQPGIQYFCVSALLQP